VNIAFTAEGLRACGLPADVLCTFPIEFQEGIATPARSKLLLVLPSGNKYDYVCAECGTAVGVKTDNDASEFYRTAPPRRAPHRGGRS